MMKLLPRDICTSILSICSMSILLSSCGGISSRIESAQNLSSSGNLSRNDISTQSFQLASWQRLNDPNSPINIYIEGDGLAWISKSTPSNNPTPTHAVALSLATQDRSPNVIYLARPCQYTDFDAQNNNCHRDYWTGKRFSNIVIKSYHDALNQLKLHYPNGFNLIGYSGGANIAGLLAAQRDDILSLRTVAGNVDNDFFTKFHKVSDMPYSLNMANYAKKLSSIPQYHFIAENDKFVPLPIFQSYARKAVSTKCIQFKVVAKTDHINGWTSRWVDLLNKRPTCK